MNTGFLEPIIMVVVPLSSFCCLQHFLVDQSTIILVDTFCTKFCNNLTPFCNARIIVTQSLSTSQCVLNQCEVIFDDITKFLMNPKFELLQGKGDVLSTIRCPLGNRYSQKPSSRVKEGCRLRNFVFLSVLSNHFVNNLLQENETENKNIVEPKVNKLVRLIQNLYGFSHTVRETRRLWVFHTNTTIDGLNLKKRFWVFSYRAQDKTFMGFPYK